MYNGWFDVTVTHDKQDFDCPNCSAGLTASNWSTEYGEILSGRYDIECPDCSYSFRLEIGQRTTYFAY